MKNPNGYGTIRKLAGKRRTPWAAYTPAIPAPPAFENKRSAIGYFKTRQEAMIALGAWHTTKTTTIVARDKITLEQLYNEFKRIKYPILSNSTQHVYKAAWNNFEPFYDVPVKNLRSGHFQMIIDQSAAKGRSRSSLHKIKVLAGLLESYAMQNDIIDKNYAQFIVLPKEEQKEKARFNDLDLAKIEKAAGNGVLYADVILIMCYTGWRITELLELTRFAYDATEKTLTGGIKTDAGKNRLVPVHPKIQPYLERWIAKGGDTIFCREKEIGRKGNKSTVLLPVLANYFRDKWYYPTLEELSINRLTPHATRHTFVSLLHKAGADKWDIQRLAGHSSEDVTNKVYTHVDITQLKTAVNMLK